MRERQHYHYDNITRYDCTECNCTSCVLHFYRQPCTLITNFALIFPRERALSVRRAVKGSPAASRTYHSKAHHSPLPLSAHTHISQSGRSQMHVRAFAALVLHFYERICELELPLSPHPFLRLFAAEVVISVCIAFIRTSPRLFLSHKWTVYIKVEV